MNETYYLTSWGKGPIEEDLGSVADGREKDRVLWKPGGEHALGFEEVEDFPEEETADLCRMNRSWPGRKAGLWVGVG